MKKFKLIVPDLNEYQAKKILDEIGNGRCSIDPYIKNKIVLCVLTAEKINSEEVNKIISLSE
ncbi:hypothetical protein KAI52_01605 [Candidatus Parcubacteria bacterium]|nr:hypothetical protein [Candidatus Parcubacteria bacterium]